MKTATVAGVTLLMALLSGCGTTSAGSKHQTMHGVSDSNYPAARSPKDVQSPALSSSTEQLHSNPGPKVPR